LPALAKPSFLFGARPCEVKLSRLGGKPDGEVWTVRNHLFGGICENLVSHQQGCFPDVPQLHPKGHETRCQESQANQKPQLEKAPPDSDRIVKSDAEQIRKNGCCRAYVGCLPHHNSEDKPAVRKLGKALEARGLRVWLDVVGTCAGSPLQEALEDIIGIAKSAAVLVGKDGLGPWEIPEMRGCLTEFVNRGYLSFGPCFPERRSKPILPLFLKEFTWVDLRAVWTKDGPGFPWSGVSPAKAQTADGVIGFTCSLDSWPSGQCSLR